MRRSEYPDRDSYPSSQHLKHSVELFLQHTVFHSGQEAEEFVPCGRANSRRSKAVAPRFARCASDSSMPTRANCYCKKKK